MRFAIELVDKGSEQYKCTTCTWHTPAGRQATPAKEEMPAGTTAGPATLAVWNLELVGHSELRQRELRQPVLQLLLLPSSSIKQRQIRVLRAM